MHGVWYIALSRMFFSDIKLPWHGQSLVTLFSSSAVTLTYKMNQVVFVLYSRKIQFYVERDLKLARFPAIISPYLAKSVKHNKSNAAFLH